MSEWKKSNQGKPRKQHDRGERAEDGKLLLERRLPSHCRPPPVVMNDLPTPWFRHFDSMNGKDVGYFHMFSCQGLSWTWCMGCRITAPVDGDLSRSQAGIPSKWRVQVTTQNDAPNPQASRYTKYDSFSMWDSPAQDKHWLWETLLSCNFVGELRTNKKEWAQQQQLWNHFTKTIYNEFTLLFLSREDILRGFVVFVREKMEQAVSWTNSFV